MLDLHTVEHGYTEVIPPYLVNEASLLASGQLPKFEPDLFQLDGSPYWLIPTAEVPLMNLHRDEILDEAALPLRYTAFTPCFRSEAGSYGRDVRGLIRLHQFHKVELVQITTQEASEAALEEITRHAETVLERLELPYRVVTLSRGDTGFHQREDARPRGLAAVAAGLPRDLVVQQLRRLPGAPRRPALPARRRRQAQARAHAQRLGPRGRSHAGRGARELPAGRRLGGRARRAAPVHGRARAHHRRSELNPTGRRLNEAVLPLQASALVSARRAKRGTPPTSSRTRLTK